MTPDLQPLQVQRAGTVQANKWDVDTHTQTTDGRADLGYDSTDDGTHDTSSSYNSSTAHPNPQNTSYIYSTAQQKDNMIVQQQRGQCPKLSYSRHTRIVRWGKPDSPDKKTRCYGRFYKLLSTRAKCRGKQNAVMPRTGPNTTKATIGTPRKYTELFCDVMYKMCIRCSNPKKQKKSTGSIVVPRTQCTAYTYITT